MFKTAQTRIQVFKVSDIPIGSTRIYLFVNRDRYVCSNKECNYNVIPDLPFTMETHKGLSELITEFDPTLWTVLVESVTVEKERMVFRFNGGVEVPYLRGK